MFNRTNMQLIESEFGQQGPNITKMEGMARGTLLVLQLLLTALSAPAQLWAAGVGAAVEVAAVDERPAGSKYTRRWWLALQMGLALFTVAMKTPISVLVALSVTDAEGNVVQPFAAFDPTLIAPEFLEMTLERLVYSDPETDVPPAVIIEQPVEPV